MNNHFTLLSSTIWFIVCFGTVTASIVNDAYTGLRRLSSNRGLQTDFSNFLPPDGSFISDSTHEFGVDVSSFGSIRNVRFQTRSPTGQMSSFLDGFVEDDGNPGYYKSGPIDVNVEGMWQWRARVSDTVGNSVTSSWIEIHNINGRNGPSFILNMIRNDIVDLIRFRPNDDNTIDLRPKILRLGFHDCVGFCDGCVDLTNEDNKGLEIPIAALAPIVEKYVDVPTIDEVLEVEGSNTKISRADIWALATLIAADEAESRTDFGNFSMTHIGRVDCENKGTPCYDKDGNVVTCEATRGDHRDLPGPDLDTHQLLRFFSEHFGFSPRETVAIMGAHTIGSLSRTNSGFDGPAGWTNNNRELDNNYYEQLVGGDEPTADDNELRQAPQWIIEHIDNSNLQTQNGESIPSRYQWFHERPANSNIVMLNSDIALVRDLSSGNEENNVQYINGDTGEVNGCEFRCGGRDQFTGCPNRNPPACPLARMTMNIAAEYKFDEEVWINDFEAVLIKMLQNGYKHDDDDDECGNEPCVLIPVDADDGPVNTAVPTGSPTDRRRATLSPTHTPSDSPTSPPTNRLTSQPTKSPPPPTDRPTVNPTIDNNNNNDQPTNLPTRNCKNSKNVVFKNAKGKKKKCSWVKTGDIEQIKKKCNKSHKGVKVKKACPRACAIFGGVGPCKFLFEG